MTRNSGNAKLTQIAHEGGVSLSTVSKVLNNRPGVAPETRKNIERLLNAHGYRRRKRSQETTTHIIELLLDELNTPWSEEILSGVIAGLPSEYVPAVSSRTEQWNMKDWLNGVLARKSAGAIIPLYELTDNAKQRLHNSGVPYVVIDPTGDTPQDVSTVGSNDYAGAREAAQYLIGQGHRHIAFIGGPAYLRTATARYDGFRSAMEQAHINIDPELVSSGEFRYDNGLEQGKRLLTLQDPPTAIFAASDMQAAGVYAAAWHKGISIPDQLSVVGFDNLPTSTMLLPPLTTVHHAIHDMAQLGAATLISAIQGKSTSTPTHIELTTHLVVRSSVGATGTGHPTMQ